ncbi:MAG: ImmA/IrrE family metallo-endopeptidase, partial [Bacteroidetes bacterium]|nr:ImmA/IrrE family metallo-endopeptidase [Bacteroidota bacterium]
MLNYEPKIIKNEDDYEEAIRDLDELMDKDSLSHEESDRLELLAHLIEEYEEEKFPISAPDPVEAIKFRMEQAGLKQKDLIPFIGDKSQVSLVLNGKKPLTLAMIRALHKGLGIPLESLVIKEQKRLITEIAGVDWNKFPIAKMYNQNREIYFPGIKASLKSIKENVEYYIKDLFEPYRNIVFANNLLRQNSRMSAKCDKYAITAWLTAIYRLADEDKNIPDFDKEKQEIILNQLRMISTFDEGPKLAKEFLKKVGIHLIILKHLPKTYLDGVSLKLRENEPVIGMTLRYDRIDYFWFTLFHELGHIFKHFSNNENEPIFDNLEIKANSEIETEADDFAEKYLIPDSEIQEAGLFKNHIMEEVIEFSYQKQIHPAIVVGRIRKKNENYYILNRMVGHGEVRK